MAAGAVLATQLISYYGYHAMIRDAYYTVTLRNVISDPKKLAEGIQFMKGRDVLFLWNFAGDPKIHSMDWLFGSIFRGVVGTWSPMFLILSALGFGGLFIHWTVKAHLIQFIRNANFQDFRSPSDRHSEQARSEGKHRSRSLRASEQNEPKANVTEH